MKRILIILTIGTLLVSTMNFGRARAESLTVFKDISKHWAEASINQAVQRNLVEGYPDGTFKPDANVTRAEFIKMVITALGIVQGPTNPGRHWYDNYVNAAADNFFYKNEFANSFNTAITRQEMSLIALRVISEEIRNDNDFKANKIMYESTRLGLIKGLDNTGTLGVDQNTTRAQSITIIERILNLKAGKILAVDKHAVNRAEVLWHGTNAFSMMEYSIGKDDPRWEQIEATLKTFNPANMIIETPAGFPKVKKVIDAILWIDLDDPQDPNRHLIPEDAKIFPYAEGVKKLFYLHDYKNVFAIVSQGRELVNEDKKNYPANDKVFIYINSGVEIDFSRMAKGDIKGQGTLSLYYDHIGEANDSMVISKDFKYFPTIKSRIIVKPPTKDFQKGIFELALWNN
ncbi:S-layer homology domain-containing protein [Paenibacillus psychroresistens]|nr:S-layer homology domain-containing protein [Paenibacillus psychroresistens]